MLECFIHCFPGTYKRVYQRFLNNKRSIKKIYILKVFALSDVFVVSETDNDAFLWISFLFLISTIFTIFLLMQKPWYSTSCKDKTIIHFQTIAVERVFEFMRELIELNYWVRNTKIECCNLPKPTVTMQMQIKKNGIRTCHPASFLFFVEKSYGINCKSSRNILYTHMPIRSI